MSSSDSSSGQNIFNISGSSITNLTNSGSIYYNEVTSTANNENSQVGIQEVVSQANSAVVSVKTILFLAANPKGTPKLRLEEEVREIDAGLQRSKRREQFVLQQRWAVRARDVQRALLDFKPQIVHFSGHGGGEEGLVLENETGDARFVSADALAELFQLFSNIECIILNACYSEFQAEIIARYVPYVIGMQSNISDVGATEFAIGFYDALGAGESIEFAYKLGCSYIRMAGVSEHLTPIFKKKST